MLTARGCQRPLVDGAPIAASSELLPASWLEHQLCTLISMVPQAWLAALVQAWAGLPDARPELRRLHGLLHKTSAQAWLNLISVHGVLKLPKLKAWPPLTS